MTGLHGTSNDGGSECASQLLFKQFHKLKNIIDYKRFKNSAADHRPSPSRSSMPRVDITRFLVKKSATAACHVVFVRRRHAEYIDSFVCSATTSGGSGGFCSSTRLRIAQHAGMSVSMYSTGSYEPVHTTHTHTHTHARTHAHAQMASWPVSGYARRTKEGQACTCGTQRGERKQTEPQINARWQPELVCRLVVAA